MFSLQIQSFVRLVNHSVIRTYVQPSWWKDVTSDNQNHLIKSKHNTGIKSEQTNNNLNDWIYVFMNERTDEWMCLCVHFRSDVWLFFQSSLWMTEHLYIQKSERLNIQMQECLNVWTVEWPDIWLIFLMSGWVNIGRFSFTRRMSRTWLSSRTSTTGTGKVPHGGCRSIYPTPI